MAAATSDSGVEVESKTSQPTAVAQLACGGSRGSNTTAFALRVVVHADGLKPKSQRSASCLLVQLEMRISNTLIGNTAVVVRRCFDSPSQVSGL